MSEYQLARPSITIVDDIPANLGLLDNLLRDGGYQVYAFPGAEMAIRAATKNPPDLFMLDINMPEIDGYEACRILKADPQLKDIPVIFISALNEPMDKVKAFGLGGVDYVNKPFQFEEVLARVVTHIKLYRMQKQLESYNVLLENRVANQVQEIADSQMATIMALAKLAESRDDDTGRHLERVQAFFRVMAQHLGLNGKHIEFSEGTFSQNSHFACALHDIGKVGIPDAILLKPGRLTTEEFDEMKKHTQIGSDTLQSVYEKYPHNNLVKMGIAISRWHHERWDGTGYPDGLRGEQIPLAARIMAVVDVYDALRSQRPYKEGFSHEKSLAIMMAGRGTQFDPDIITVLLQIEREFDEIFKEMT
ncbi:MAG: HD domain-containing phosphohydrolase [Deltaproteobacteria bacterium]